MAYGASKAAALSLTKSVALHCAESNYNIRCNAVLPGVVMTPMVEGVVAAAPDREAALAQLASQHPIGRMLEGREVAAAVVYFASTWRRWTTISTNKVGACPSIPAIIR